VTAFVGAIDSMTAADRSFVISGWSASMRSSRDLPLIPMDAYATIVHPIIEHYLDHVLVTTQLSRADNGVLRGFVVADPSTYSARVRGERRELRGYVYYLYVAAPFRGWGIARALLAAAQIDAGSPFGYAVRTRSSYECRAKMPFAEYDPYRARFLSRTSQGDS
jgi:GNAT superfamily N-acetyltransferase